MWRSFVILFIVSTNLCNFLHSYKIANSALSKTSIETYDEQDFEPDEENYSSGKDLGEVKSTDRVVIGKWRNNGGALEPKWRDGDSVPLAPFSAISFQSGWEKDTGYNTESVLTSKEEINRTKNINNKRNKDATSSPTANNYPNEQHLILSGRNNDKRRGGGGEGGVGIGSNEYRNYNTKPVGRTYNFEKTIRTSEDHDSVKNGSNNFRKLSSSYRDERVGGINVYENIKSHQQQRYHETLDNYPTEYELFESEENSPKPRKRRPPENYDPITGSLDIGNIDRNEEINDGSRATNKTKKPHDNVELKAFLRMQTDAGLSLSEILQQKNLTLADLLKGKPNVINILKSDDNNSNNDDKSRSTVSKTGVENEAEKYLQRKNSTDNVDGGETRSSQRRKIAVMKIDDDTSLKKRIINNNDNKVKSDNSSVSSIIIKNNSTDIENVNEKIISTNLNESSVINTSFSSFDEANNQSEKFDHVKDRPSFEEQNKFADSEERLVKPLKNRGSSSKLGRNDERKNSAYVETEDDQDEIMEFSDYPGKLMPQFIVVPVFEPPIRNKFDQRNNIPSISSAMNEESIINPAKENEDNLKSKSISNSDTIATSKKEEKMFNEIGGERIDVIDRDMDDENQSGDVIDNDEKISTEGSTDDESETKPIDGKLLKMVDEPSQRQQEKPVRISSDGDAKIDTIENNREYLNDDVNLYSDKTHTFNNKIRDVVVPKVDAQSRAEILELFSSGSSAERLERLLASRNMSIEELIALRQRGSSQVHFAQIFQKYKEQPSPSLDKTERNRLENQKDEATTTTTTMPTTTTTTTNKKIHDILTKKLENESLKKFKSNEEISYNTNNNTNTNNYHNNGTNFNIETEYLATDLLDLFSRSSEIFINNNNNNNNNHSKSQLKVISEEIPPEMKDSEKFAEKESSDAKNVQRDSEGLSYYTSIERVKLPELKDGKVIIGIDPTISSEIGRVKEINNLENALLTGGKTNQKKYSEERGLSKVRPSIIASGGILGVTIVVFLSILIACRIHQKKKFNGNNSLAKSVFNNKPVTTARKLSHTSSVNSIMVDVVATSTVKRKDQKHDGYEDESDDFESKSKMDNDSLNANDSWETIPDFMK